MLDKPIKISGPTKARMKVFMAHEISKSYDDAINKLLDGWNQFQELKKEQKT
jgi:hypothetical protein